MALWLPGEDITFGNANDKQSFDTGNGKWTEKAKKPENPPKNTFEMPVYFPKRGSQNASKSWVVVSENLIVCSN